MYMLIELLHIVIIVPESQRILVSCSVSNVRICFLIIAGRVAYMFVKSQVLKFEKYLAERVSCVVSSDRFVLCFQFTPCVLYKYIERTTPQNLLDFLVEYNSSS